MHLKMPAAHLSSRPSCFATKRPPVLAVRRWQTFAAFAAVGSSRWLSTGVACGDGDACGDDDPPLPVTTVSVASPPVFVELIPVTGSCAEIAAVPTPTASIVPLFGAAFGAAATVASLDTYTTCWVRFFVPPSSNVPVAEKFTVVPTVRLAVDGETTRLTRRGVAVGVGVGLTVRVGVAPLPLGVAAGRGRGGAGDGRGAAAARARAGRGVDGGDDRRAGADGEHAALARRIIGRDDDAPIARAVDDLLREVLGRAVGEDAGRNVALGLPDVAGDGRRTEYDVIQPRRRGDGRCRRARRGSCSRRRRGARAGRAPRADLA